VSSNKAQLVSVIIPTRNRAYILRSAIQSILRQTYNNLEIVIVDDNSTDSTSKVVEKIAKDNHNIKYIRNDIHKGLPASRNIGLSYAKGNLIFFSEDDLILMPNTIEILVKTYSALSKRYKVGAVAPRLILVSSAKFYSPLHEYAKIIGYFNMLTGDPRVNYDVETSHILLSEHPPATSLIPRDIFNTVGTYYTGYKYTYYYEESDLYYRISKHGFIMFYQPSAVAFHVSGNPGGCTVGTIKRHFANVYNLMIFDFRMFGVSAIPRIIAYVLKKIEKIHYINNPRKEFEKVSTIDKIGFKYSYVKLLMKYKSFLKIYEIKTASCISTGI